MEKKISKQEKQELQEKFVKRTNENAEAYKSGKEKIHTVRVVGINGEKTKTVKETTYPNGVVKNRLIRVEKALGGGKKKRIF